MASSSAPSAALLRRSMATSSAAAAAAAADPSWCTPGVAAAFTSALPALGRARRYPLRLGGDPEKNHVETLPRLSFGARKTDNTKMRSGRGRCSTHIEERLQYETTRI